MCTVKHTSFCVVFNLETRERPPFSAGYNFVNTKIGVQCTCRLWFQIWRNIFVRDLFCETQIKYHVKYVSFTVFHSGNVLFIESA